MRILHLSADYPDPMVPRKTRAIANLLSLAPGHEHRVYSLNRCRPDRPLQAETFEDSLGAHHRAVRYPGLPLGIGLQSSLTRLAAWIKEDLDRSGFLPDLVHVHKLTIEGIAGELLATRLGAPLAVSSQGNTDLKILRARPDLRSTYARIWHGAALAFPFAPWTRTALDHALGPRTGLTRYLPCPGPGDALLPPIPAPPVIRTAFHLHDWRNKNVVRLFQAVGLAAQEVPQIVLEVIGGGDAATLTHLKRKAQRYASGHVRFLGPIPHADMQAVLNTSAAFALVSHRESFGMVFSEALLAGTPCLFPKDRAIDGYLPDGEVTLSASPRNTADMARGLVRLVREQKDFKARLHARQRSGGLEFLRRSAIAEVYADALALLPKRTPAIAMSGASASPDPAEFIAQPA